MKDLIDSLQYKRFDKTLELVLNKIESLFDRYTYQEHQYDEEQYQQDRQEILSLTINFNRRFVPPLPAPEHNPNLEVQRNAALVNNLPDSNIIFEILESLRSFILTYDEGKERWAISARQYSELKELFEDYKNRHSDSVSNKRKPLH